MLPYSATDALNSMSSAYGLTVETLPAPMRHRQPRFVRWLRTFVHLA